ncbi:MAG: creatininase family protein [candidate division WOR-3 bacterium]
MKWELLSTYDEFFKRVFFPVGTVEPHGPLPVGTDNIAAEYIAHSLAKEFNAAVIPLMPFGVNRSLYGYKGGISISPKTFKGVIYDVCKSLKFSGVEELVIFNGHGGNTQHLKDVMYRVYTELGIKCASIDWWVIDERASYEVFGRVGGHGGIEEFALVYMAYPEIKQKVLGEFKAYYPRTGVSTYPSPRSILLYNEGKSEGYDVDEEKIKTFVNRILNGIRGVLKEIFEGWQDLSR